jgi:hypothetical protein
MGEKKAESQWAVESPEDLLPLSKCYQCPSVVISKLLIVKAELAIFGKIGVGLADLTESFATGENSRWCCRRRCRQRPLRGAEGSSADAEQLLEAFGHALIHSLRPGLSL